MAAIPQRLETSADDAQACQRRLDSSSGGAPEPTQGFDGDSEDIPIFCSGGCGEVMGYVKKGQSIPTSRCPACEAAEAAKASLTRSSVVPLANTDELAGLRQPPRDLRKLRIVQVAAVALIFAGSIYIAMGRPVGIYLAAFGTAVWVAVALAFWRLRN